MVNSVENISEQLFQVISGFGHQIVLFTDEGKRTTDPTEARRFYAKNIQMMVNYVVDETTNEIVVNLSKDTDIKSVKDMLTAIRNLANRYIIEYTVKTFGKSIEPRDFAYMAKNKVQESVAGTVSKSKIGWFATNLNGKIKSFRSEEEARSFAKTGKSRETRDKEAMAKNNVKESVRTLGGTFEVGQRVLPSKSSSNVMTITGFDRVKYMGKMVTFADGKDDKGRTMRRPLRTLVAIDDVQTEATYTDSAAEMKVSYDYDDDFYMLELYVDGQLVAKDDGYPGMNGTLVKPIQDLATNNGIDPEELTLVATDDNLEPDGRTGTLRGGKISWSVNEINSNESAYDSAMNEIEQLDELTPRQKAIKQGAKTYHRHPYGGADKTSSTIKRWDKNKTLTPGDETRAAKLIAKGPRGTASAYDKGHDAAKDIEDKAIDSGRYGPGRQTDNGRYRELRARQGKYWGNKNVKGPIGKLPEGVNEGFSGWTGSARKSVNQLESARIIVKHKRTVDEEKRGARTRQIESIFIENAEGERFKFPSNNITAAKAMARHVQEGGAPFDDFGQHIYGIMEELNQLKTFSRKNKRNDFFEDAQIGEEITAHIGNLRSSLKSMSTPRGYAAQMEGFTKESEDVSQERIDELKDATTMSYFDESIADSLPYVARVIETLRARQANESRIVEFARQVMNNKGGFALAEACDDDDPESPSARTYKDKISEVAAWAAYLAPKVQNEALSSSLAQLEENLASVGSKHVNMAMSAINVVKQQGTVAEAKDIDEEKVDVEEAELRNIAESLHKYDVRKIFGV